MVPPLCFRAQDFFLREARAVVTGPMAVVRLGTCGCLQESVYLGRWGEEQILGMLGYRG